MSGKKSKLKKIELTSVDMVRRGANQEAHINLYKSEGGAPVQDPPPEQPEGANPGDIPQGLWKSIVEAVKSFMSKQEGNNEPAAEEGAPGEVEKSAETFENKVNQQELRENRWKYQDALATSIESILYDNDLSHEEKINMFNQSIEQFADAYKEMCVKLLNTTANKETEGIVKPRVVGKSQEIVPDNAEEGEEEMKIDKSRFEPEELAMYEKLIAKGLVKEDDEDDDKKVPAEKEKEVEKSAEMHPEVKKALEEMAELRKSMEMKEMTDVAKKYVTLGKKEDELAATLYEMKKSSQATYDAYISVLDQNLELVNKSGLFEEIGKSNKGVAGGSTEEKIAGIAKSYIEKDPTMDYDTAVMKAWENNPELLAAYDNEY